MIIITNRPQQLCGELTVTGDKSITHRALILGALAEGTTEISGFLDADDCRSTISCLQALGVQIDVQEQKLLVKGCAARFQRPQGPLDAGNSGTTARLLLGVLAGQPFQATLTGDSSLKRRPMKRVTKPLALMGASFPGENTTLPLNIQGGRLKAIEFQAPQASAQVKSAVLLAALNAEGETTFEEPYLSRNHTELMLTDFGVDLQRQGSRVSLRGGQSLQGHAVKVPGDLSTAAFYIVAAAIVPGSEVLLRDVGVNPTRTGIIHVLQSMGADLKLQHRRRWGNEPVADLLIRGGRRLNGLEIGGEMIPALIDEIPILAVAASLAHGKTMISGAGELRVKETDRLAAVADQFARLGLNIEEKADGLIIEGNAKPAGAEVESLGDHRIAMALAVAGLAAEGDTVINGAEAIKISCPRFMQDLRSLLNS